jgi:hypothetical protein
MRSYALALVGAALVLALTLSRYGEPRPAPADAPADAFSGTRAHAILAHLLAEEVPHPVGSRENRRVRDRILSAVEDLGYLVDVQTRFVCGIYGSCATVENVLAWRPDAPPSPGTVALVAHYDSVPAGPGAGDDGSGVAALLELARLNAAAPITRHPLLFLFTDGEEAGLLGARAFLEAHPFAAHVVAAVNVEAAGTAGPSAMFETGRENRRWASVFGAAPRPVGSALAYEVYRRLPNDTDLTHFVEAERAGLNFALIGRRIHYHTPLDRLQNVSPGALQHHGDNVLAALRALDRHEDPALPAAEDAVFFDVAGSGVLRWSAPHTIWFAAGSLAVLLAALLLARMRGLGARSGLSRAAAALLVGAIAIALGWAVAGGAGWLVLILLQGAGAAPSPWIAHPLPSTLAAILLGGATAIFVAGASSRAVGADATRLGGALLLGVVSVFLALRLPAASPLFLLPSWAAAFTAGLWAARAPALASAAPQTGRLPLSLSAAFALPAVVAALMWIPLARLVPDAVGVYGLPVWSAAAGILASLVAWPRRFVRAGVATAGAGALAVVVALLVPVHTPSRPAHVNIELHRDQGTGESRWVVHAPEGEVPGEMVRALVLGPPERPYPWSRPSERARTAPAPALPLEGPRYTIVPGPPDARPRTVHLRLSPGRDVRVIALALPLNAQVAAARLPGEMAVMPHHRARGAWTLYSLHAPAADGTVFEIAVNQDEPIEAWLMDWSMGLPAATGPVVGARGEAAVPIHLGDGVRTSRRLEL